MRSWKEFRRNTGWPLNALGTSIFFTAGPLVLWGAIHAMFWTARAAAIVMTEVGRSVAAFL